MRLRTLFPDGLGLDIQRNVRAVSVQALGGFAAHLDFTHIGRATVAEPEAENAECGLHCIPPADFLPSASVRTAKSSHLIDAKLAVRDFSSDFRLESKSVLLEPPDILNQPTAHKSDPVRNVSRVKQSDLSN